MSQYLDKSGLTHFWNKLKTYIDEQIGSGGSSYTKIEELFNLTNNTPTYIYYSGTADADIPVSTMTAGYQLRFNYVASSQTAYLQMVNTSDYSVEDSFQMTKVDNNVYCFNGDFGGAATFPVQPLTTNAAYFVEPSGTTNITVDSSLDSTSTNPVQNKVIKATIDTINERIDEIVDNDITDLDGRVTTLEDSIGTELGTLTIDSSTRTTLLNLNGKKYAYINVYKLEAPNITNLYLDFRYKYVTTNGSTGVGTVWNITITADKIEGTTIEVTDKMVILTKGDGSVTVFRNAAATTRPIVEVAFGTNANDEIASSDAIEMYYRLGD